MFVTTAGRTNEKMIKEAQIIAADLTIDYAPRLKRSVRALQEIYADDCLVVGKERLELYPLGEEQPFFFHPNSSMFRIKRMQAGETDPFIEACQLKKGSKLLDCTLGLASDSIVASFAVGEEGNVVGIEGNLFIAYIVEKGLQSWEAVDPEINAALKRISVVNCLSLEHLKKLESCSYDCVYLDPMFEEQILESNGIKELTKFALYEDITQDLIYHAKRVAKERVVLKDHYKSKRFAQFGFQVNRRKTAKFHYGVLQIQ
ncbi:class I SAM-dependent methyltransferase [Robertmurraya sp. DFI.2.37]|uniref:class I SAM-dependent methyltransferase n=1 Tax=Robertmurraya sp. DFI.2.37 TaxID=3031819 RepID=UPI0023DB86F7|nr:class I SAM-dependent methyltransferase [Robertmurraya sp. DFI.2.37]MDF1510390.1 class I SAM-dependent methyltransferase [Robertmurraya sp. DFI.2.37]